MKTVLSIIVLAAAVTTPACSGPVEDEPIGTTSGGLSLSSMHFPADRQVKCSSPAVEAASTGKVTHFVLDEAVQDSRGTITRTLRGSIALIDSDGTVRDLEADELLLWYFGRNDGCDRFLGTIEQYVTVCLEPEARPALAAFIGPGHEGGVFPRLGPEVFTKLTCRTVEPNDGN